MPPIVTWFRVGQVGRRTRQRRHEGRSARRSGASSATATTAALANLRPCHFLPDEGFRYAVRPRPRDRGRPEFRHAWSMKQPHLRLSATARGGAALRAGLSLSPVGPQALLARSSSRRPITSTAITTSGRLGAALDAAHRPASPPPADADGKPRPRRQAEGGAPCLPRDGSRSKAGVLSPALARRTPLRGVAAAMNLHRTLRLAGLPTSVQPDLLSIQH